MSSTQYHLPEILRVAFEVAGAEAAVGLSKALGGKSIYIPRKCGASHPLVVAGGRKAADAIMAIYGSQRVDFPKGGNLVRHILALEALNAEGGSFSKAVTASGLHFRTVKRLKAALKSGTIFATEVVGQSSERKRPDSRQLDMEEWLGRR